MLFFYRLQKTQSAFIHGFRYNTRTLFHFLEEYINGKKLPSTNIPVVPEVLAKTLLKHLNRISSLWQQVGFLTDVLVPDGKMLRWYHDLPYQYVMENQSRFNHRFFIIMFLIKPYPDNTFNHPRNSDIYQGEENTTIHPLIEYHVNGEIIDKFHVLEDFLVDWSGVEYVDSATNFFQATLSGHKFMPPKRKSITQDKKKNLFVILSVMRI